MGRGRGRGGGREGVCARKCWLPETHHGSIIDELCAHFIVVLGEDGVDAGKVCCGCGGDNFVLEVAELLNAAAGLGEDDAANVVDDGALAVLDAKCQDGGEAPLGGEAGGCLGVDEGGQVSVKVFEQLNLRDSDDFKEATCSKELRVVCADVGTGRGVDAGELRAGKLCDSERSLCQEEQEQRGEEERAGPGEQCCARVAVPHGLAAHSGWWSWKERKGRRTFLGG